jgi:hypothetical protein
MPTINLEVPSAGQNIGAGLHAANYADLQALLNGGLDGSNLSVVPPAKITGYPADGAKVLKGDGTWGPAGAVELIFDHVPNGTSGTVDSNTILGGDLPTTYKHLKAIIRYAHDNTSAGSCMVRFNNNSAAAYSYTYALLQGSSITSNEVLLQTWGFLGTEFAAPAGWGTNSPATTEVLFPFYRDTSIYRNYQFEGMRYNAAGGAGGIIHRNGSGIWRAVDPIGRLQFLSTVGNWTNQARITLYGIR